MKYLNRRHQNLCDEVRFRRDPWIVDVIFNGEVISKWNLCLGDDLPHPA